MPRRKQDPENPTEPSRRLTRKIPQANQTVQAALTASGVVKQKPGPKPGTGKKAAQSETPNAQEKLTDDQDILTPGSLVDNTENNTAFKMPTAAEGVFTRSNEGSASDSSNGGDADYEVEDLTNSLQKIGECNGLLSLA